MSNNYDLDFSTLTGKTFVKVERDNANVTFHLEDGSKYILHHHQDCCEVVWLEDVCGDLIDLENTPILSAHASTATNDQAHEHGMWTFYNISTGKGSVTLRFCGESNGYYSMAVSLDLDESSKKPDIVNYLMDNYPELDKRQMMEMICKFIPETAWGQIRDNLAKKSTSSN